MKLTTQLVLSLSILISHFSSYGQTRNVEIEYKIVSPTKGDLFISPSKIPVSFIIYNHGTDSLYATDSFSYFISHEILYPYLNTENRQVLGKNIAPGDSSRIFTDTTFVNWTFDSTTYYFRLNVLCSYFTPGLGDKTILKVTNVPDQKKKRVVMLKHDYLSTISEIDNLLIGLTVFPNPVTSKILNVEVAGTKHSDNIHFDLISSKGARVQLTSDHYGFNYHSINVEQITNGVYTLVSTLGEYHYYSKVIIMH